MIRKIEFATVRHFDRKAISVTKITAISSETIIPFDFSPSTARTQLNRILDSLHLDYTIRDTTPEDTESQRITRVYDVRPLHESGVSRFYAYDEGTMVELIERHVAPNSWDDRGGPAPPQPCIRYAHRLSNDKLPTNANRRICSIGGPKSRRILVLKHDRRSPRRQRLFLMRHVIPDERTFPGFQTGNIWNVVRKHLHMAPRSSGKRSPCPRPGCHRADKSPPGPPAAGWWIALSTHA
jgi:hypothetical protein